MDNFERSLNVQNPSEEVRTFLKGYQMIFDQLMNILKKNGVEVIEAQGKEFDPNLHQAVMTTQDENFDHNVVVEELQKGYKLKDGLDASVSVVKQHGDDVLQDAKYLYEQEKKEEQLDSLTGE